MEHENFIQFLYRRDVPKRAVMLAFIFVILGLFLFLLGFNEEMQEWDPFGGFIFWGAGLILFLPGCYFSGKLIQAFLARDPEVRSNILREIPEL